MLVALWSPKGGSGTSVTAAGLAIAVGRSVGVRLVDLDGDQPAIFGIAMDPDVGVSEWMGVGDGADIDALDDLACPTAAGVAILPCGRRALDDLAPERGAQLAMALRAGARPTIIDAGRATAPAARALVELADATIVVLRGCYLALRRAVHDPLVPEATGVIVVEQEDRPLRAREVSDVIQRPILAALPQHPDIARAVDAGVLPTRTPPQFLEPLAHALRRLDGAGWGRAA